MNLIEIISLSSMFINHLNKTCPSFQVTEWSRLIRGCALAAEWRQCLTHHVSQVIITAQLN